MYSCTHACCPRKREQEGGREPRARARGRERESCVFVLFMCRELSG